MTDDIDATSSDELAASWEGCSRLVDYSTQSFFTLVYCQSKGVVTYREVVERLAEAITTCTRCLDNVVNQPLPMETSDRWGKLGCRLWNIVTEKSCFAASRAGAEEGDTSHIVVVCRRLAQCLAAELFLAGNMCYSRDASTRHAYLAHHPTTVVQCVLMCARTVTELCTFKSSDDMLRLHSTDHTKSTSNSREWKKLLLAEARRLCQHGERIISEEGTTALRVVYSAGQEQTSHSFASLSSTATSSIFSRNQQLDDAIWEWRFSRLAYLQAMGDLSAILETMRILLSLLVMPPLTSNSAVCDAPRAAEAEPKAAVGSSSIRNTVNPPPMSFTTWTERKEFLLRFMFFLHVSDISTLTSPSLSSTVTEGELIYPHSPKQSDAQEQQHQILAQIRILSLELQSQEWIPPASSLSASGNAVVPNTGAPQNSSRRAHLLAITHQQIAWSLLRACEPQEALGHAKAAAVFFGENDSNALALVLRCAIGTQNSACIAEPLDVYCKCQSISLTNVAAACYEVFTNAPAAVEVACAAMRCVVERVVDARAREAGDERLPVSPGGRRTVVPNEDEEESLLFYYAQILFLRGVHRPGDIEHLRRALQIPTLQPFFPLITNDHGRQYFQWAVMLANLIAEGRTFDCQQDAVAEDDDPGSASGKHSRTNNPVSIHGNAETLVSTLCTALFFASSFASREERSAVLCRLADVHCRRFNRNGTYDPDHIAKAEDYALQATEQTPTCPFANSLLFRIHVIRNNTSRAMKYLQQLKTCEPRDLILPAMCTALADTLDTCSVTDVSLCNLSPLQRTASQYILQYILLSTPPSVVSPLKMQTGHRPVYDTMNADMLRLLAVLHRDALRDTGECGTVQSSASMAQLLALQVKVAERLCAMIDATSPAETVENSARESRKRSRSPEEKCEVDDSKTETVSQQCFTQEEINWWLVVLIEDGYAAADRGSHASAIHLFRSAVHLLKKSNVTRASSAASPDLPELRKAELMAIQKCCGLALLSEELLAFSTLQMMCYTSTNNRNEAKSRRSTLVVHVQDNDAELPETRRGEYSDANARLSSTSVTLNDIQETLSWCTHLLLPCYGITPSLREVQDVNSESAKTTPVNVEEKDISHLIVAHAIVGILRVKADGRESIEQWNNCMTTNDGTSFINSPHISYSVLQCIVSLAKQDAPFSTPLPAMEQEEASTDNSMVTRMCQELTADDFDYIGATAEGIANEHISVIQGALQEVTLPASVNDDAYIDQANRGGAGFNESPESFNISDVTNFQEQTLLRVAASCWCLSAEKRIVTSISKTVRNGAHAQGDDVDDSNGELREGGENDPCKSEPQRLDAESVLGRLYQAYTNTHMDEDRESVVSRVVKCTNALSHQSSVSAGAQRADTDSGDTRNDEERGQRRESSGGAAAAKCGAAGIPPAPPVDSVTASSGSNQWDQHSLVRLFLEFFATESWNRAVLFWNVESMERARSWFKKADALASHVGAASALLTAIENLRASLNEEQSVEE